MFRLAKALQGLKGKTMLMAAPVALIASAAPLMGAGPWDWHFGWGHRDDRYDRDRGRVEVVVRPEPRVIVQPPRIVDVAPCDLKVSAYQSNGSVMVLISGTNPTGGFTTSLAALDTRCEMPKLVLHNTSGAGYCTQVITPVSINAAFKTDRCVSSISLRVADRDIWVPVTAVPSL